MKTHTKMELVGRRNNRGRRKVVIAFLIIFLIEGHSFYGNVRNVGENWWFCRFANGKMKECPNDFYQRM